MLKEEYELVKELSKIANRIKKIIPPMMLADLRLHISSIQRMIFAQAGIREYRKDHAKYVVEHLPDLFKKGSKHRVESITPTPDYGYQVKVTPILAEAITGKKPIKISTRTVKNVPAGMEAQHLSKKHIDELKELMTNGRPSVGPDTPEIRVYKKGSKIPKGWYRIPYTRDKYTTNEGYEKLVSQEVVAHESRTGSRFVGGVHSGTWKGRKHNAQNLPREGWTEHGSPLFISDIPHLENTGKPKAKKKVKKNIPKKVGKKSPAKKKNLAQRTMWAKK